MSTSELTTEIELEGSVAPPLTQHPLLRFVVKRVALGLVTLVAATVLVFLGTNAVPGSPASAVLGRRATPAETAKIDRRIGYDKPLLTRYVAWLGAAVHGDFGVSATAAAQGEDTTVASEIKPALVNTLILALITTALLIPLSFFFGAWAGWRAKRPVDHAISIVSLVALSLPEFVVGSIFIVIFAIALNVLPPVSLIPPGQSPLDNPQILVLPVFTLLSVSVGWTIRLVRIGVIEVLKADHVRTARLNGFSEKRVLRRDVLRNAVAPSIQAFALSIQYLFGGVIVTEAVFGYPGIGTQLVQAVTAHDNTQVQAIALILATIYIAINILADLAVVLVVPKLRTQS
jgi:peptide/nickel transport system permease protein